MQAWQPSIYSSDHLLLHAPASITSPHLSRWVRRRQRKLVAIAISLLLGIIVVSLCIHPNVTIREHHYQPYDERCAPGAAANLVRSLCSRVAIGLAHGSMCRELCSGSDSHSSIDPIDSVPYASMAFDSCLHHGDTYVLEPHSEEAAASSRVVLKRKSFASSVSSPYQNFAALLAVTNSPQQLRSEYQRLIADHVQAILGERAKTVFAKTSAEFFESLLGGSLGSAHVQGMNQSFQLLWQQEPVVLPCSKATTTLRAWSEHAATCTRWNGCQVMPACSQRSYRAWCGSGAHISLSAS